MGEFVLIAQMAGRVARHHDKGIDIEFVGQQARSGSAVAKLDR